MSETHLNQRDSLRLIAEMISQAKSNYGQGGSFYFLLWGWVIMLANFGHYVLAEVYHYEYPYAVWLLTLPAVVWSAVYGARQRKEKLVVGHFDRMHQQVWLAAGAGIIITLVNMGQIAYYHNAIILLIAGIGTFISGQLLKFKPLVLGGIALWIASLIAFRVPVTDQYLIGGFGILLGYLVPGYMLKNKEK